MAFKVNGVEVFSDDGALSKQSITAARDGATSDITGTDELILFDGDGGDDVMKVTIDEFFDRDINMGKILPTAITLRYLDPVLLSLQTTRETNNVNSAFTLTSNSFLRLISINMEFQTTVDLVVKWANSDNTYGFDRVQATWDGANVIVTDALNNAVTLNQVRAERLFGSTANTNIPYYEQEGSLLWVGFQNNNGPNLNSNVNVTYVTDSYPQFPPAP